MKTLVIVHVYYPQLWPELLTCLHAIQEPHDVIVTYGEAEAVAVARRDLPGARFLPCENVGYDIWPFLKALQSVDLSQYDVVVKLHTKRDVQTPYCANNAYLGGTVWRKRLLAFVKSPTAWHQTRHCLTSAGIGMVADRRLVFNGESAGPNKGVFDRARAEVRQIAGADLLSGRFVAGSMFAVRAEVLKPLVGRYAADLFAKPEGENFMTFAHVIERLFGLLVSAAGLRVEGFNGSVDRRNAFYAEEGIWNKVARFFFWRRYVDGEVKVKICRIQVWHRMMKV